jgi:hypothetical protein
MVVGFDCQARAIADRTCAAISLATLACMRIGGAARNAPPRADEVALGVGTGVQSHDTCLALTMRMISDLPRPLGPTQASAWRGAIGLIE